MAAIDAKRAELEVTRDEGSAPKAALLTQSLLDNITQKLSAAKKAQLEEDLALQQRMEELRKKFATLAKDFTRWAKDTVDTVSAYHFGDTLEAVQAYAQVMNAQDDNLTKDAETRVGELQSVWTEAQVYGASSSGVVP